MSRFIFKFTLFLLILWRTAGVFSLDVQVKKISDDSSIRRNLYQDWFIDAPVKVLTKIPFISTLPDGARVEVRTEVSGGDFSIVLARQLNAGFPGWAQGSWILTRQRSNGLPVRIRFFPRSDPYTYIQFRPSPSSVQTSVMDIVVYDAYIGQSISLHFPFDKLLTMQIEDILAEVGDNFPVRYFEPKREDYRDVRSIIDKIRLALAGLSFADDGAIDENGEYVFIDTQKPQESNAGLNCSGFAKWTIDGILRPVTGGRLAIAPLKAPFGTRGSDFTGPYEESRDPFFGLDWIRNLAAACGAAFKSSEFGTLDEIEVRQSPFAQVIVRAGKTIAAKAYPGFLPNAGYGFEGLHALLYTLAIDEPGFIFLGAVNNEMLPKPRMRQFYHIAVLIPYFDDTGSFHTAVFESAVETPFTRFKNRYPSQYINLVRIPVESAFEP
ncbi:hypothetical protein FACS1894190_11920 [Spirochaetia bacterium]|nr:hypothetical protein FACS1894190_11920 [Spirochaetia bacterium]